MRSTENKQQNINSTDLENKAGPKDLPNRADKYKKEERFSEENENEAPKF